MVSKPDQGNKRVFIFEPDEDVRAALQSLFRLTSSESVSFDPRTVLRGWNNINQIRRLYQERRPQFTIFDISHPLSTTFRDFHRLLTAIPESREAKMIVTSTDPTRVSEILGRYFRFPIIGKVYSINALLEPLDIRLQRTPELQRQLDEIERKWSKPEIPRRGERGF